MTGKLSVIITALKEVIITTFLKVYRPFDKMTFGDYQFVYKVRDNGLFNPDIIILKFIKQNR